jgi:hypothetical protein
MQEVTHSGLMNVMEGGGMLRTVLFGVSEIAEVIISYSFR